MNAMHPLLDIGVAAARAAARVIQEAAQSPAALEIRRSSPTIL